MSSNDTLPSRLREGSGEGLLVKRSADKGYKRPTARSRELRMRATDPEKRLWRALSSGQIGGTRFNRQFPIGPFICDFVSRGARLVIEVDGERHDQKIAADRARTRFLEANGYQLIRFRNAEVMENLNGVLTLIEMALRDRPSPGPSRKREGSLWGPTIRWYRA